MKFSTVILLVLVIGSVFLIGCSAEATGAATVKRPSFAPQAVGAQGGSGGAAVGGYQAGGGCGV